ncbi:MAG: Smr/MutS family protein [Polyangiaceae bacterium]
MKTTKKKPRPHAPTNKKATPALDGSKQRPFATKLARPRATAAEASASKKTGAPRPAATSNAATEKREGEAGREPRFADLMLATEPLKGRKRASTKAVDEPISSKSDDESAARESLATLVSDALRFEVLDDGSTLEGRRVDVDPRELRRLRRLAYAVDGKLDLHGHTTVTARLAVERFLERRRMQGDRAIVIVHGRGTHTTRGDAILRGELGAWLSQGAAARHVLAFASIPDPSPHREHSGALESGAVFVLLAKR